MSLLTDENKTREQLSSQKIVASSPVAPSRTRSSVQPSRIFGWLATVWGNKKFSIGILMWLGIIILLPALFTGFVSLAFFSSLALGWGLVVMTLVNEEMPARKTCRFIGLLLLIAAGLFWFAGLPSPADYSDNYLVGLKPDNSSAIRFSPIQFSAGDKLRLETNKLVPETEIDYQFGLAGEIQTASTMLIGDCRVADIEVPEDKNSADDPLAIFLPGKSEDKPSAKSEDKPKAKPDEKSEGKPEDKSEGKPDGKSEDKPVKEPKIKPVGFFCQVVNVSRLGNVDKIWLAKQDDDQSSPPAKPGVTPSLSKSGSRPKWETAADGTIIPRLQPGEWVHKTFHLGPDQSTPWIMIPKDNYRYVYDETTEHGFYIQAGKGEEMKWLEDGSYFVRESIERGDIFRRYQAGPNGAEITFSVHRL